MHEDLEHFLSLECILDHMGEELCETEKEKREKPNMVNGPIYRWNLERLSFYRSNGRKPGFPISQVGQTKNEERREKEKEEKIGKKKQE